MVIGFAASWIRLTSSGTHPSRSAIVSVPVTIPIHRLILCVIDCEQGDPSVAGRVILSNVTADAEGTYKCEVSIEAPTFYTDSTESNMSVIGEPEDPFVLSFRWHCATPISSIYLLLIHGNHFSLLASA